MAPCRQFGHRLAAWRSFPHRLAMAAVICCIWAILPARANDRWSCGSGAYRVAVTDSDVTAGAAQPSNGAAGPTFSARAFASIGFDAERKAFGPGDNASLSMERKFSVVSLVGPWLALRDEAYIDASGTAHPGGETRFWTVDLRRSGAWNLSADDPFTAVQVPDGRLLFLQQLFPASEIRTKLAADPFVRRAVHSSETTLDDLLQDFAEQSDAIQDVCFSVPDDLMSRFAILGAQGPDAVVRIGLPGAGPCRYNLTQLGLLLHPQAPADGALASALSHACRPPAGLPPVTVRLPTQH